MKTTRTTVTIRMIVFSLLASCSVAIANAGNLRLIVMVDKSKYESLSTFVGDSKGSVSFKYKYAGAMAVTIPAEKMSGLLARPEVTSVVKDETVTLEKPRTRNVPGYGSLPWIYTTDAVQSKALTTVELQGILKDHQGNYYPYENQVTHAFEFSQTTGQFGENVIVGIIDAGVSSSAVAVGSRVIGAENFTNDGIPANSSMNGDHGTWVACCVGANAMFGFSSSSTLAKAVKAYAPGSVLPNIAPGIDGIPMVGQAPGALFYALKVFPAGQNSTSRSIIAAALDRAIELKEMYNSGAGGSNIRIVNMSLGGPNLFAGNDPLYAPLVKEAQKAGIVLTVSSGNDGPSGLTIGTPGDSKGILSSSATSDAVHGRIIGDLFFGTGKGAFFRPVDNHIMADFSSRGPTADGRVGTNLAAPGDWRYAQGAAGGIFLVSGTSFSAPTIAGAAALLISAHPNATPDQIRGALLGGANAKLLDGKPQAVDQGFGFLDVVSANKKFGAFNPVDIGLSTPLVALNVLPFGIVPLNAKNFSGSTGWLAPGQRKEFYIQTTTQPLSGLTVQVNVTPELPGAQQNQLFGDDAEFAVATGKTSFGDYRVPAFPEPVPAFITGSNTFALDENDLDWGITRVTVVGDYTNAGRVKADVQVVKTDPHLRLAVLATGKIAQGDAKSFPVNVPAGRTKVRFALYWINGWEVLPTNDLDVLLTDPNGNIVLNDNDADGDPDGFGLDAPERVTLMNPIPGQWTATVLGSTGWSNKVDFVVLSDVSLPDQLAQGSDAKEQVAMADVPQSFKLMQNSPNPFNPSTIISYSLPVDVHVQLAVYNTLGQEVASLVDEDQAAGNHRVVFTDPGLASGVYFYRLQAGSFQATNKLTLLK